MNMAITGADSSYCNQQKYLSGMNSVAVTKYFLYDLLFRNKFILHFETKQQGYLCQPMET